MLIGRDVEHARIRELVDGAREGRSGVLLLGGEAGIGKTSLLRAAEQDAAGLTVLRARGVESESDLPFAGLSELLAPVLSLRGGLPEVQRTTLEGALALGPVTPGADLRFAMAAGTLGLLALAAEERPVLAIVDDLQWLDEASADAILFAARRLGSEGVAILLAARDAPGAPFEASGVERLGLAPLSEARAREVLAAAEGGAALAPTVADRLLATAAGNPLALTEIPGLLDEDQRAGRAPLEEPLPAGTGIARAFARRLEELPDDARAGLLLAAADESARLDVLLDALQAQGHDAGALERAEVAGVVELERGHVRFRHPLWRSAAYHAATPAQRRAAHETLAGAWPEDAPARAWHRAEATLAPDESVAADLEAAAHAARERGAHPAAAQAFARAAHVSPADADRARRLLEAARDALLTGQPQRALAHLDEAEGAGELDSGLRADLQALRGRLALRTSAPLRAHEILVTEAERLETDQPGYAAALLVEAAVAHMMTGDMEALRATAARAQALAAEPAPPLAALAELIQGEALAALGRPAEADPLLDRWRETYDVLGLASGASEIVGMAGHASIWLERYDRAEAVLSVLIQAMRTAGGFGSLVYPLAVRSHLHFRRGRWSAAYADAGESVRLADDLGVLSLLAHALGALAEVEAATGREADCRAHAARALEITSEHQADAVALYSRHALALLELGLGNPAAAIDQLSVAESIATRLEQEEPALVPWRANYVEALVLTGRPGEAERELVVLERQAEATGRVAARAAALRCRGLLAAEDDYEARFAAALELHRETPTAFEEGRTQLALGGRRRRARRRGDARAPLRAALEIFERLGARPWADTARAEIRATGETVERREGTGIEELSPHELQVARLVAEGRTNRECAAALFLSPKTIEYHLGQIYRKLGIRGRTALAAIMAEQGEAALAA